MTGRRTMHPSALAVLLATVLAAGSLQARAQQAASVPDDRLQAAVERQIDKKDLRMVTAAVKEGVVTLTGTVPHLYAKNLAYEAARKTKGVVSVVNEVVIEKGENDQLIGEFVAGQVRRYPKYTVFDDVMVMVKDGKVLIGGAVTSPDKVSEINDLASRVAGVQEIRNVMTVLPVSPSDEQLRYVIANNIYGDPMFQQVPRCR